MQTEAKLSFAPLAMQELLTLKNCAMRLQNWQTELRLMIQLKKEVENEKKAVFLCLNLLKFFKEVIVGFNLGA